MYYIFRSDSINGNYTLIDSTVTAYYLDSGLINLKSIAITLRVRAIPCMLRSIVQLLIYHKVCDIPFDFTPPPPPDISTNLDSNNSMIDVNGNLVFQSIENCESGINSFQWTNPNNHGADDAVSYRL